MLNRAHTKNHGIQTPLLAGGGLRAYALNGVKPATYADFIKEKYLGTLSAFSDFDFTRTSNATMVDSDGLLKWAPHNLALNSGTPATQSITVISGADYTVEVTGSGSMTLSGAGTGSASAGSPVEITASTTTLTITLIGSLDTVWVYRSDLGGMVDNPDTGNSYVPTTSAPVYSARRGHYLWSGTAWFNAGVLLEPAATNLLLNSRTLSTQNVTTTAQAYTLSFTGTGTVTLSGTSTAGPLVGTGTGENNRVNLTFTPTAGTLTLTVSGTVTNAQLEAGSNPTSYVPTTVSTATRATDQPLSLPSSLIADYQTPTVIGTEMVTNGTFDTDTTGWTGYSGTIAQSSGSVEITNGTSVVCRCTQPFTTEVGKVYHVTASSVVGGTATNALLGVGNNADLSGAIRVTTDVIGSDLELVFVATSTTTYVGVTNYHTTTGLVGYFDNVSVKEINPLAVCFKLGGHMTYADTDVGGAAIFYNWEEVFNNKVAADLRDNAGTGQLRAFQYESNTSLDIVTSGGSVYTPGVNVPFSIAVRHGSTFIQAAAEGTATSEDSTPKALFDGSATDIHLAYSGGPMILEEFGMWVEDLAQAGIEEGSTP